MSLNLFLFSASSNVVANIIAGVSATVAMVAVVYAALSRRRINSVQFKDNRNDNDKTNFWICLLIYCKWEVNLLWIKIPLARSWIWHFHLTKTKLTRAWTSVMWIGLKNWYLISGINRVKLRDVYVNCVTVVVFYAFESQIGQKLRMYISN